MYIISQAYIWSLETPCRKFISRLHSFLITTKPLTYKGEKCRFRVFPYQKRFCNKKLSEGEGDKNCPHFEGEIFFKGSKVAMKNFPLPFVQRFAAILSVCIIMIRSLKLALFSYGSKYVDVFQQRINSQCNRTSKVYNFAPCLPGV